MPDIPYLKVASKRWEDPLDTAISSGQSDPRHAPPPESSPSQGSVVDLNPPDRSFELAKKETAEANPEILARAPFAARTETDLNSFDMPDRTANLNAYDFSLQDHTLPSDYQPTILDKVVDFLSTLMKRLERFLIGRLRSRRERRRYRLRRIERTDMEDLNIAPGLDFNHETTPGEKIKWQDRSKRRARIFRE